MSVSSSEYAKSSLDAGQHELLVHQMNVVLSSLRGVLRKDLRHVGDAASEEVDFVGMLFLQQLLFLLFTAWKVVGRDRDVLFVVELVLTLSVQLKLLRRLIGGDKVSDVLLLIGVDVGERAVPQALDRLLDLLVSSIRRILVERNIVEHRQEEGENRRSQCL